MSFCPADAAVFHRILANDPECKACFECGSVNPQWCDVNHAVFICLECSGVHRSLGVHLSFVRSSTMDGWTNWNPAKLKQMELGGNRRARLYFAAHGVPTAPIRARYESLAALRYASMLESESEGVPFNEAAWQPPEWYGRMQAARAQPAGSPTNTDPNRFAGMGSAGSVMPTTRPNGAGGNAGASAGGSGGGGGDWLSSLSSGWNLVSQRAGELAQQASTSVKQTDMDKVRESASRGWSSVAASLNAFSTTVAHKWTEAAGTDGGQDGLDALTGHAREATEGQTPAPVSDDRFRGYGSVPANPSTEAPAPQMAWGTSTGFTVPSQSSPVNATATSPVFAGHAVTPAYHQPASATTGMTGNTLPTATAHATAPPNNAAAKTEKWGWDDGEW